MNVLTKLMTSVYKVSHVLLPRKGYKPGWLGVLLFSLLMFSCVNEDETDDLTIIDPESATVNWTLRTINAFPAANRVKAVNHRRGPMNEATNQAAMLKMMKSGATMATYHYNLKQMGSSFPTKTTNRVNDAMVDEINEAFRDGDNPLIFIQISGTPRVYDWDDVTDDNPNGNFYPLPKSGTNRTQFVNNVASWIDKTQRQLNGDVVWLGTQEPAHTIGKPAGVTGEWRRGNIAKYVKFWKEVVNKAKSINSNIEMGGIQLNSPNKNWYTHTKNVMNNNNLDIDYVSFQLYSVGKSGNDDGSIKAANNMANSFGKKMVAHRGFWVKGMREERGISVFGSALDNEATNTSEGMLHMLRTELQYQAVGNCEGYGMAKPNTNLNAMQYKVFDYLQAAPKDKRRLENLPAGVDGFVLANNNNFYAFLYNDGNTDYQLKMNLNTAQYGAGANLETYTFKGTGTTKNASYMTYNHGARALQKIRLRKNHVAIIKLTK